MWMESMLKEDSLLHDEKGEAVSREVVHRGTHVSTRPADSRKGKKQDGGVVEKSSALDDSAKVVKGQSKEMRYFHSSTVDSLSSIGDVNITKAPSFGSSASNQDEVVRALRTWSRGQWSLNAQDSIDASSPSSPQNPPISPVLDEECVNDVIKEEVESTTGYRGSLRHRR